MCVETNTSTGSGNFPGVAGPSPQLTLQREEGVQLFFPEGASVQISMESTGNL